MDVIESLIDLVKGCVCEAFDLCECCGHSGVPLPPVSECCDCGDGNSGRAYVQIERIYPTEGFPGTKSTPSKCHGNRWAVEFTITLYRCIEVVDDEGAHPECAATTAEMYRNIADMAAMRETLICCTRQNTHADDGFQILIREQIPVNPLGGCGGTLTRATMTASRPITGP